MCILCSISASMHTYTSIYTSKDTLMNINLNTYSHIPCSISASTVTTALLVFLLPFFILFVLSIQSTPTDIYSRLPSFSLPITLEIYISSFSCLITNSRS